MAMEITGKNFDAIAAKGLTLVDFWATWCGPCQMMAPIIEEIAQEYAQKATIGKVDVDKEQELAIRFGIMSIPTIFIIKDGKLVKQFVGVVEKKEITSVLDASLI